MKFYKKFENFVTNTTAKKNSWKTNLLKRTDKNVRHQFSCLIKDFSYLTARTLFFVNIWSQKWNQTGEVTLLQERYLTTKWRGVIASMAFSCVTLLTSNLSFPFEQSF